MSRSMLVRARAAYEAALREAVREGRAITWIAGIPKLWGVRDVVVHRVWGAATDYRSI